MSWFEEQIKLRKLEDDEVMARSFVDMAGVVMGSKLKEALNDSIEKARNSLDLILKYYGIRLREFPDEIEDLNYELDGLLHPFGIMKREVKLKKGWYKDAYGPMLGFLKENGEPVALIPGKGDAYLIKDGITEKRVNFRNADLLMEDAICFYKPFPLKKLGTMDILMFIIRNLSIQDVLFMVLATAVATMIGMMTPRFTYWLFSDELLNSGSRRSLIALGTYMTAVAIGSLVMNALKSLILSRIQRKTLLSVEAASMMRVLSLPSDFFKNYSAGEISQRMSYITSLSSTMCTMILSTGLTAVLSLAYITQIMSFAPGLLGPSLFIIQINVVFSVVSGLMQMKLSRERMEKTAKESGMTYSLISGIQKIKLAGAEKKAFGKWSKSYSEMAALNYNPPMFIKLNGVIGTAIGLIGTLVMYYMALRRGLTVAEYTAFNAAYGLLYGGLSSLFGIALEIAGIRPYLKMVEPIFSTLPELSGNKEVLKKVTGAIELAHVSFQYSEDTPLILNDLSLKIRPGQYVAIAGKTGSGKSTLLRLLIGFETPQKGSIFYDGKDMKNVDLQSLRRHIGTVLQNGKLIYGSIFENIAISEPALTLDEAWEAAEMADIADDIREMPMEMQTIISEGGGGISGGQKQRLLIARAVAAKPKILMFDEATSALDNKTQKQVSEALDSLKCTRIVIAHRLSTIKNADRILVLDKGRIIEDGNYEELIANKGFFAELVERQLIDTSKEP